MCLWLRRSLDTLEDTQASHREALGGVLRPERGASLPAPHRSRLGRQEPGRASRLNPRSSRLISDRRGAGRARAEAGRCLALPLGQGRDPPRSAEFCGTGCDRVQDTRRSFTPQAHNVATVTSGMRQSLVIELWVRSMRVASSGEIEPSGAPAAPHALDLESKTHGAISATLGE